MLVPMSAWSIHEVEWYRVKCNLRLYENVSISIFMEIFYYNRFLDSVIEYDKER